MFLMTKERFITVKMTFQVKIKLRKLIKELSVKKYHYGCAFKYFSEKKIKEFFLPMSSK